MDGRSSAAPPAATIDARSPHATEIRTIPGTGRDGAGRAAGAASRRARADTSGYDRLLGQPVHTGSQSRPGASAAVYRRGRRTMADGRYRSGSDGSVSAAGTDARVHRPV